MQENNSFNKNSKTKINQDTLLKEVFSDPKKVKVLAKYHLPCLNCPLAFFEIENLTLKEVSQRYDIDLEKLLKELNQR